MISLKTTTEIIKYAIMREEEALQFYTSLKDFTDNPEILDLLEILIAEEAKHKSLLEFEIMKNGTVVHDKEVQNYIPREMIQQYGIQDTLTLEQLIEIAIQKEVLSSRLYIDLARLVKDPDEEEIFIELAQQELEHKLKLRILLDQ